MTKTCKFCGAEMDENAIKCPQCEKNVPNAEILLDKQRQKHKKKLLIISTVIICIVLITGIIVLSAISKKNKTGGNSYVDVIDMNIASMINNDSKQFLNSYPEFMRAAIEENLGYLTNGDFNTYIDSLNDEIIKVYGSNVSASYEVLSKQHLDDDTSQQYLESIFEYTTDYNIDDFPVEDAYQLNISFTFNGSVGTQTFNTTIATMQFDGSWYLLNIINPINTETDSQTR